MIYKIIFIVLQCTWGLPQTLIGLGFYIVNSKHPHKVYRGCIDTQWNYFDYLGRNGNWRESNMGVD